jgi:hypothetical protein
MSVVKCMVRGVEETLLQNKKDVDEARGVARLRSFD